MRRSGLRPRIIPSRIPERALRGERPERTALRLARAKAAAVAGGLDRGLVVGADTLVVVDGRPLGKPRHAAEARAMLRRLSGRTHRVVTAVAVIDAATGRRRSGLARARVRFRSLSAHEIARYVRTSEPADKAGAYAFQGGARRFVRSLRGSPDTVIGLPRALLRRLLRDLAQRPSRC